MLLRVHACSSGCSAQSTRDQCGLLCVWARRTRSTGSSIPGMSAMS